MTVYQQQPRSDLISWSAEGRMKTAVSFTGRPRNEFAAPTRVRRNDPYAVVSQPYRKEQPRVVWGVSHQPLIGQVFYLPIPQIQQVASTTPLTLPESAVQLQIRQVRFEIGSGQIRWLVRRLTNVHVIRAETIVPGVLNVWVNSQADADRVCNILHHNVLFDCNGVFVPLTQEQRDAILAYTETRQFHTRSQRLPRELMSVVRMYSPPPPPPSAPEAMGLEPVQMPPPARLIRP